MSRDLAPSIRTVARNPLPADFPALAHGASTWRRNGRRDRVDDGEQAIDAPRGLRPSGLGRGSPGGGGKPPAQPLTVPDVRCGSARAAPRLLHYEHPWVELRDNHG